jgi:hypothetical protein
MKRTNNLSQDRWSAARDPNTGTSEYEAGVLTNRPGLSVTYLLKS